MIFNRGHITRNPLGLDIGKREIQHAVGMLNASIDDAIRYGGSAVRAALSGLRPVGGYKHLIVDVKMHMLKKGMNPAIPGWHTDGVPRGSWDLSPFGPEAPDLQRQEGQKSPTYHLLVAGCDAPTAFLERRNVEIPDSACLPTPDLYARITDVLERKHRPPGVIEFLQGERAAQEADWGRRIEIPNNEWWTWDWWELHTGQPAREDGWRMLIRVTESDYVKPEPDLRKVIRTHQQAYISGSFGW